MRSYRIEVEIEGLRVGRIEAVKRSVGRLWEYNSDFDWPGDGSLQFTGYQDMAVCYPPARFVEEIARGVWEANSAYCRVRVDVTDEGDRPGEEFEFTREEFDRVTHASEIVSDEASDPDRPKVRIEGIAPGGEGEMLGAAGHIGVHGQGPEPARRDGAPGNDAEGVPDALVSEEFNHLDRPLELQIDPMRLDDSSGDGSLLLSTVKLLWELHHLTLLRVRRDPIEGMVADSAEHAEEYHRLHRLYEGPHVTVEVPGHRGTYVAYMHPYG